MNAAKAVGVLTFRQGSALREPALHALWSAVEEHSWFELRSPRIVVDVGRTWHTPLVAETARSLAAALVERRPDAIVDVVSGDPALEPSDERLRVAGIAAPEVTVPAAWFESFFLVTVTGAGPDRLGRIHGALAAQADQLRRVGNGAPATALVYEAHRLGRSDLVVVCGPASARDETSEAWWIVSPSDVGADMVLARACGIVPTRLPLVRAVAAREVLPEVEETGQRLPRLQGFVAPRLGSTVRTTIAAATASGRTAVRDVRMIRRNLTKVPHFVRRRLAAARGKA